LGAKRHTHLLQSLSNLLLHHLLLTYDEQMDLSGSSCGPPFQLECFSAKTLAGALAGLSALAVDGYAGLIVTALTVLADPVRLAIPHLPIASRSLW
jgi:hypothetical protein